MKIHSQVLYVGYLIYLLHELCKINVVISFFEKKNIFFKKCLEGLINYLEVTQTFSGRT